jgi:hypothetical protein
LEKWVQQLPARWARNAAIATFCVFVLPVLPALYYLQGDAVSRTMITGWSVVSAAMMAFPAGLVFWVTGLVARAVLRWNGRTWDRKADLIVLWWTIGGAFLFVVVLPGLASIFLLALGHNAGSPSWRGSSLWLGPVASAVEGSPSGEGRLVGLVQVVRNSPYGQP